MQLRRRAQCANIGYGKAGKLCQGFPAEAGAPGAENNNIGGMVSEDEGQTWSREFVIRDDASTPDIGYPVATELEDGRIFAAYYYTLEDGSRFGGARFIAGSFFRIKE